MINTWEETRNHRRNPQRPESQNTQHRYSHAPMDNVTTIDSTMVNRGHIYTNTISGNRGLWHYVTPRDTIHNFNPLYKRFSKMEIIQAFIYKLQSYLIKSLFKVSDENQAWFPRYFIVFYCFKLFQVLVLYHLQCIVHVKTCLIRMNNIQQTFLILCAKHLALICHPALEFSWT